MHRVTEAYCPFLIQLGSVPVLLTMSRLYSKNRNSCYRNSCFYGGKAVLNKQLTRSLLLSETNLPSTRRNPAPGG